ncbi:transposase [Microvirga sp. HBU67558]|nr:transposase [Microvirga sp. HBU67558]
MRFGFIEQHARTFPVRLMCRVLGVSASGYYAWRSRPESQRAMANRRLLQEVQRLHAQHQGRYGSPRMHAALRAQGHRISRGRVERLMRQHGIRALARRHFRPTTTDSQHTLPIAPAAVPLAAEPKAAATPAPVPKLETVWRAHIYSWHTSGLSRSAYCQSQGLALRSFNAWIARLRNTRRHLRKAI